MKLFEICRNIEALKRIAAKYGFYRSIGNIIDSEESQRKAIKTKPLELEEGKCYLLRREDLRSGAVFVVDEVTTDNYTIIHPTKGITFGNGCNAIQFIFNRGSEGMLYHLESDIIEEFPEKELDYFLSLALSAKEEIDVILDKWK